MPSFVQWRDNQNIYCVVDNFLPATKFVFSGRKLVSCVFPGGQTISVGDVVDGKTVRKIEKNSESLMLITE